MASVNIVSAWLSILIIGGVDIDADESDGAVAVVELLVVVAVKYLGDGGLSGLVQTWRNRMY